MELVDYIRAHTSERLPVPCHTKAKLTGFPNIKAVVFDIYGTLLVSAPSQHREAMQTALRLIDCEAEPAKVLDRFYTLITEYQKREQVEFPEVDIREVWTELLNELSADTNKACDVAVAFECHSNPVWPMPGFSDCLRKLNNAGMRLGIISNAQFYTPLLFPALCDQRLETLGFDNRLTIFSYQIREGKPSRKLFSLTTKALLDVGVSPDETLYIGNDRLKDIWPASQEGFKTVLFAGDQQSLRNRTDDARLTNITPDAVVTHLDQIPQLLT